MEKVFVVLSYWYGLNDESRYGEETKVEGVVVGNRERAVEVEREISAKLKNEYLFCYTDIAETTITH